MTPTNLLDHGDALHDLPDSEESPRLLPLTRWVAVLIVLGACAGAITHILVIRINIATVAQEHDAAVVSVAEVSSAFDQLEIMTGDLVTLHGLRDGAPASLIMAMIAEALPKEVKISELALSVEGSAKRGRVVAIRVDGIAGSHMPAVAIADRIAKLGDFRITGVNETQPASGEVPDRRFSIGLEYPTKGIVSSGGGAP